MRSPVSHTIRMILVACSFTAACGMMTPEARLRSEIFWEDAKACEGRYRTLHIDRIDMEGNVGLHADAESRQELPAFNECYRKGLRAEVETRRKAGIAVPELPSDPRADVDCHRTSAGDSVNTEGISR